MGIDDYFAAVEHKQMAGSTYLSRQAGLHITPMTHEEAEAAAKVQGAYVLKAVGLCATCGSKTYGKAIYCSECKRKRAVEASIRCQKRKAGA